MIAPTALLLLPAVLAAGTEVGSRWPAWEAWRARAPAPARSAWFAIGPTRRAGRFLSLAPHPTDPAVLWAGSAGGGVWRTTDGGEAWTPLSDSIASPAIGGIAVSPLDPDLVVIGTGEATPNVGRIVGAGLLRSLDGGDTWLGTSAPLDLASGHGFHFVEVGPTGTFLAGATDGLWRSTDDGATWIAVRSGGDWYDAKWQPGSAATVYAVKGNDTAGNGVKKSTDDGATWSSASSGFAPSFRVGKTKLAVTPAAPDQVHALVTELGFSGLLTGVYLSTNGAANWQEVNVAGPAVAQGWYNLALAASPDDAGVLTAGAVGVSRSTDSGTTWAAVPVSTYGSDALPHVDQHAVAWDAAGRLWLAGDGGLWRSSDAGATWEARRSGLVTFQFYDVCAAASDPLFTLGTTQDNGAPGRETFDEWFEATTHATGSCVISPADAQRVYVSGGFVVRRSTDGGHTWQDAMNGITGPLPWTPPLAMDASRPQHLFLPSQDLLFRTTNGGLAWQAVDGVGAISVSVFPGDGETVWTLAGTARVSTDHGDTWAGAGPFGVPTGPPERIRAHPTEGASALVACGGWTSAAHIVGTTDHGATWHDRTGDLPAQPVHDVLVDPSRLHAWYAATDLGVWATMDSGATWAPAGSGFPATVVTALTIRDAERKLLAATHGRGVWEIDLPPAGTGVRETAARGPERLLLDPPRPSPSRGEVVLRFAARSTDPVTLEVVNVAGRRVATIAALPAGDGVIRVAAWDPHRSASGVYFAVLRSGGEIRTRRIVLAR